ncbi:winged helix-turn-helix transcriptional regulator [Algimonas porphyrae]|uniref:Transcriptional regulator n=1 Tax=Algimonas porphyrae TaxID=1128113 RepID=A0ABQ5V3G9_9PROT|nr:helix-turn-helix domain-containing protein [Algimonas porphyrae]GLQ21269.1 transcriptional regulator [Algimonas porphyrae]
MARKKPYDDGCATAHALDLIGERWALLIVRELVPGPKRFSDLRAALPGISTNILTNRLSDLETTHILIRRQLPPPAPAWVYELTPWGLALEPLIQELGRWAARSPGLIAGKPMSPASIMLSFRTMFDPERAGSMQASLSLVMNGLAHRIRIEAGELSIELGKAIDPDVHMDGDPNLVAGIVYGEMSLDEARAAGLTITGEEAVLHKFVTLFPLPPTAPETCSVTRD